MTLEPLAMIVAISRNGVIGQNGHLPWSIPEDLKFFKSTTLGHAMIMGRRTHESIGRVLPGRRNIVVTSNPTSVLPGGEVARSLDEAIAMARTTDPEPMVIGGAALYRDAMPLVTRLYLTEVHRDVEGDVQGPEIDAYAFTEAERIDHEEFSWVTLVRR